MPAFPSCTDPTNKAAPDAPRWPTSLRRLIAAGLALFVVLTLSASVDAQNLNWSTDIGAVGTAGDGSFDTSTGAYHLKGAGTGPAGTADAFHFAYYQIVHGDGQMVVRLSSADALAQSALVVREGLDANAASAAAMVSNGVARFVRRLATGSSTVVSGMVSTNGPCWLKLVRSGSTITAWMSADGQAWISLGSDTVSLGTLPIYVGLAVSNGVSNATNTAMASFDNIQSTFLPGEGLLLWLRADVGVTQDSNGVVSAWADQSGNSNDAFQGTASQAPTEVAAGINGQPVIRFDGGSSFLHLPSGFSDFTQGVTALVVAKPTAAVAWQRIFELANGPSVDSIVFGRSSSTDHLLFECVNGNGNLAAEVASGDGAIALGTPQLFECSQNGTGATATLYKNGQPLTIQGAAQIGNVTRTRNLIGTTNFGGSFFAGDIAEIVLFDHSLTDTERQVWEHYLNAKYQYAAPPAIPSQLILSPLSPTRIVLSWTEATQNVTGYTIERQNPDGSWSVIAVLGSNVTSYIDTGLTAGTAYSYRVTATNAAGASPSSAAVTLSTPAVDAGVASLPVNGVLLWLRANAGLIQDASGTVSRWADQSGNDNDAFQAIVTNQPTLVASAIGNEPAIHFDGANSYLQLPTGFSDFTRGMTALIVMRPTSATPWQRFFELATGPSGETIGFGREGSSDHLVFQCVNNYNLVANADSPSGTIELGVPQLFEYSQHGAAGTVTFLKNEQVLATQSAGQIGNVTRTSNFIGCGNYSNQLFGGDIAEIVIINHALTDGDRHAWERYLNLKYHYTPAPAAPTQLRVLPFSSTQILLSWNESSQNVNGYIVERQNGSGPWTVVASLATASTGYADKGLAPGSVYSYRVTAVNDVGSSPISDASTGTTLASGGYTGTLPMNGLEFWLRADAGVTADSNGLVSAWTDQLGGLSAGQSNPSIQPSLIAHDVNGLPALRFDGGNNYLDTNFVGMGGQELTFFVVTKGNQYQSLLRFQPPGSGNYLVYPWSSNPVFINSADGGAGAGIAAGLVSGQWNIGEVTYKAGDQMTTYDNGNLVASRAAANIGLPGGLPLTIGRYLGGGEYLQGDVAEVLIYNRALSSTERETVEDYLNGKYAIVTPPSPPGTPVVNTISATQTNLLWTASANATGYSVERKNITTGGNFEEVAAIAGGSVQAYVDSGLATGVSYAYRVRASGLGGYSAYSNEISITLSAADGSNVPMDDLLTWLRADAGIVQSATHAVSAWTDLSGHGNDAKQSSPSNQPQSVASAINNEPVVHFDGGSSFLQFPADLLSGLTAGEVLIVLRSSGSAGSAQGLWNLSDNNGELFPWVDGSLYETFGAPSRYGPILTTVPLDRCNLYEVSAAPGVWTMRLDGSIVARNNGNTPSFAGNTFLLGRNAYGNYFAGDVAEMLIFSRALSDNDRQIWEHYLNAKYHYNPPPATPTSLQATPISASQVMLTWTESTPGGFTYTVERQNADGTWSVVGTIDGGATSFVDTGLTPGAPYSYRVTASNDIGASPASVVASGVIDLTVFGSGAFPVSGVRLWLRTDVGVAPDANGGVMSWADQSGGDRTAIQTISVSRPKLISNVVNGRSVVRFGGTGSYLNLADHLMSGVTAGEVFVVVRAATPLLGSYRGFWYNCSHDGGNSGAFYPAADGTLYETFGTDTRYGPMSSPAPLDQFNLYNVAAAPGAWTARMNGQVISNNQTNNPAFSATTFLLGISSEGSPFAGDVAELLIFDHVLSDSERAAVQKYCTARYALNGFLGGDANADPDGDGLTNYQEFLAGSDSLDYYNGQTPLVAIAGGNNQLGAAGAFVSQPLRVRVTSAAGTPLVSAPVVFTVTRSAGLVADPAAPTILSSSVTVHTGSDGMAAALFQAPAGGTTLTSLVTATAGYANWVSKTTFAEAIVADDDTSGDGLPDGWKLQHGLDLTVNEANGDPDGDGLTNFQEYYLGTDPNAPDFTSDGISVSWMVANGLDPRYDSTNAIDPNGVGLTYAQEFQLEQSTVDLWRFDEGGQSVVTTSSAGRKDVGAVVNQPAWVPDPDGGTALSFNQLGAQVDFGVAADGHLDFGTSQSFSLTARFQTSAAGTARLVGKGVEATSGAAGYFLGISDGHLTAGIGSGDAQSTSLVFQTGAAFNNGQWHHVAATFDRSAQQARLYVDGILQPVSVVVGSAGVSQGAFVDLSTASGLTATRADAALRIGAMDLAGTGLFTGVLDNVGLFSKALTALEVQALAGKQNNLPPVVAIDWPLPAAVFPESGDVPVSAQASSSLATISKVEFFSGTAKLGEAHSYPYAIAWGPVPLGVYAVTAKATDSRGASSISAPVSITVSADSDHDGLPDDWELEYFGNLDQSDSGSYLNDGLSNLTKYLLGLDPTKPVTPDANHATGLVVFTPLQ